LLRIAMISMLAFLVAGSMFSAEVWAEEENLLEIEFDEITVFHPSDWLGHGNLDDVFYLFPLEAEYEDFLVNINFIIEAGEEKQEEEFGEEFIATLEASIEDFSLKEKEEIMIDGQSGFKLVSTGYLPEIFPGKIKWMQFITSLEKARYLVITYTASKESFPDFEEEAVGIILETKIH